MNENRDQLNSSKSTIKLGIDNDKDNKFYNNIKLLILVFILIFLILLSSLLFSSSTSKQKMNKKPNLFLTNSISSNNKNEEKMDFLKYLLYQLILNYKGILSGITFLIQLVKNNFDSEKKKKKLISTIISEIKKMKENKKVNLGRNQLIEMSSSYNIKKGEFIHKYLADINQLLKDNNKEKDKEKKNKNEYWIYFFISIVLLVPSSLIIVIYRKFEYISNTIEKIKSEIKELISSNCDSISESKIDQALNIIMKVSKFVFGEGFVYVGMKIALGFIYRHDNDEIDCILKEIEYELEKKMTCLKKEEKYTWKNGLNIEEIKKIIKNYYEKDKDNNIDDILLNIRKNLTMSQDIEIVLNENKIYYMLKKN